MKSDRLSVATLGEALELRAAGVELPILVLGYTPPRHAKTAVRRDVTLTVYDADMASVLARAADDLGKPVRVHVKVNTGMNRLGLRPDDAPDFLANLREHAADSLSKGSTRTSPHRTRIWNLQWSSSSASGR